MRREITRTDLYERVWTESVGAVAKEYGISDVALAKICKKNNIPLPPRGYWAKLRAGKRLPKTRLTERALGGAEILDLGKEDDWRRQTDDDIRAAEELLLNTPVPERVVFAETIEDVRARVRRLVGQVKVEKSLAKPHAAIAGMLEHDRKNCERRNSGPYPWHTPLFQSPFEKRRLKIINAIGKAVGKLGGDLHCGRVDPGVFHAVFGATSVPFSVDDKSNVANYQRPYYQKPDRSDTEPLVLQSRAYVGDGRREPRQWQDSKDTKLEEQLTEIAVSLAVDAEAAARYAVERRRAGLLERRREIIEKRRKEHDAVILAARAEARRFVKLTYQKLLSEARRYSQAQEIRAYVEAASDAVGAGLDGLEEWRSWALAQADAIDPVLGGAFLRPVEALSEKQNRIAEAPPQTAGPPEQSARDAWHPNRQYHYHRSR